MRLATLLSLLLIASAALAQDGPLVFETTVHDFGEVREEAVSVTFVFVNAGGAPLRLVQVQPSCGCTVPRFTDTSIPPGGTGEVVVAYDATARAGSFSQTVNVVADVEGKEATATLRIHGSVVLPWTPTAHAQGGMLFDVETVNVGTVRLAEDVRQSFRMHWTGSRPVRVTSSEVTPAPAHVRLPRRTLYPDDVMQLDLLVPAGGLGPGPFEVVVRLHTDDEVSPVKLLRLTGLVE